MPSPAKLKNREIQKLHEGLVALDGVAAMGGGVIRFQLDDKTVWDVARNRVILAPAIDALKLAKTSLGAKYHVVEGLEVNAATASRIAAYMDAVELVMEQEVEISGLANLKESALKAGKVTVPGILANLMAIIEA